MVLNKKGGIAKGTETKSGVAIKRVAPATEDPTAAKKSRTADDTLMPPPPQPPSSADADTPAAPKQRMHHFEIEKDFLYTLNEKADDSHKEIQKTPAGADNPNQAMPILNCFVPFNDTESVFEDTRSQVTSATLMLQNEDFNDEEDYSDDDDDDDGGDDNFSSERRKNNISCSNMGRIDRGGGGGVGSDSAASSDFGAKEFGAKEFEQTKKWIDAIVLNAGGEQSDPAEFENKHLGAAAAAEARKNDGGGGGGVVGSSGGVNSFNTAGNNNNNAGAAANNNNFFNTGANMMSAGASIMSAGTSIFTASAARTASPEKRNDSPEKWADSPNLADFVKLAADDSSSTVFADAAAEEDDAASSQLKFDMGIDADGKSTPLFFPSYMQDEKAASPKRELAGPYKNDPLSLIKQSILDQKCAFGQITKNVINTQIMDEDHMNKDERIIYGYLSMINIFLLNTLIPQAAVEGGVDELLSKDERIIFTESIAKTLLRVFNKELVTYYNMIVKSRSFLQIAMIMVPVSAPVVRAALRKYVFKKKILSSSSDAPAQDPHEYPSICAAAQNYGRQSERPPGYDRMHSYERQFDRRLAAAVVDSTGRARLPLISEYDVRNVGFGEESEPGGTTMMDGGDFEGGGGGEAVNSNNTAFMTRGLFRKQAKRLGKIGPMGRGEF